MTQAITVPGMPEVQQPWKGGWQDEALAACNVPEDQDWTIAVAAADDDGHFAYVRMNEEQATDLFYALAHALAERRGVVAGRG